MGIYETYYNCRREPFSQSPDPRFLYLAPSHREALAQLRYTVESGKGFAVLTGEVGTGKTTLLRTLLQNLRPDIRVVSIFNRPRSVEELYAVLAEDLGLAANGGVRPILQFERLLTQTFARGGRVLIVLDEAQGLKPELLEEIRLLSNLETSTDKLVQVILAGQPEFDAMLDCDELRALRQRVVLRHRLEPLSLQDTVQYIANRLRVAGASRSPFTYAACRAVHRYSGGLPRQINALCDNAMLLGYASDQLVIERAQVEAAARDLKLEKAPGGRQRSASHRMSPERRMKPKLRRLAIMLAVVTGLGFLGALGLSKTGSLADAYSWIGQNIISREQPRPASPPQRSANLSDSSSVPRTSAQASLRK